MAVFIDLISLYGYLVSELVHDSAPKWPSYTVKYRCHRANDGQESVVCNKPLTKCLKHVFSTTLINLYGFNYFHFKNDRGSFTIFFQAMRIL